MAAKRGTTELIDRAAFASRRNEWDEALGYAEKALALEPEHYLAHKRRSLALWGLGRQDEALAAMQRSAEIRPDFESAHYNLACFYARLGRRDEMLRSLRRAIELASAYMDMASKDVDFEDYEDDAEFIALVRPNGQIVGDLANVLSGGDLDAITNRLQRLGKDIPLSAVDWDDEGEGGDLSKALCEHAEKLDIDTLLYLFRLIAVDVLHDLYAFDGWHVLNRVLQEKARDRYEALLVETWKQRYSKMDAGHLGTIEYIMLHHLGQCAPSQQGAVALKALRSHGPDAVQDLSMLCASSLAGLSDTDALAVNLVDELDRAMHGTTHVDEDPRARRMRVVLALPPPPLEIPPDSEDRWIRQRVGIESFHPQHVVSSAESLSIQRDPAARAIVEEHQERLAALVVDDAMPDDIRVDAAKVLEKVGTSEVLVSLAPALHDRSPNVLFAVGKAMRAASDVEIDSSIPARHLIALLNEYEDWSDQYEVIRALRWFPTSDSTRCLLDALQQGREAIRREALYGLGYHDAAESVDAILEQLLEGSGQCVTAAAEALGRMEQSRAKAAFRSEEIYSKVLGSAKRSPRWATKALMYFDVPSLPADLFELFCTTKEFEAIEHLAHGISLHPSESLLPGLVEFGLDTYRMEQRSGRYLIEIARAAVADNPSGPSPAIRDRLVALLSDATTRAVMDLSRHLDADAEYADERANDPEVATTQRRSYAERLAVVLAPIGEEVARLPRSLFGVAKEA